MRERRLLATPRGPDRAVRVLSSAAGVLVGESPRHAFPTNRPNYVGASLCTPPPRWRRRAFYLRNGILR